ncbi:hypothetical protein DFJ74DRAFT_110528 [Hyaloraphidium curvatum]|nr:hypothetical protein DFJ74DRAFT_110528 [Hyaloraphidium curvatum]
MTRPEPPLGHPPLSAVAPDASATLARLRDTFYAACDRHLARTFLISQGAASSLPAELHALVSSLPDFSLPFHPFSRPGQATIGLWTALCDPPMLKQFGRAAMDAAGRAREAARGAEGAVVEAAEGVGRRRADLWAVAMMCARVDAWGVWKEWRWWTVAVADFAFAVSQHPESHPAAMLLYPLVFDFYLLDPLGLDRSPAHVPTYRAGLASFARGVCQVLAVRGTEGDEAPWKEMVDASITRLLSDSIAPSDLPATTVPLLRLDFARALARLGDAPAALAQLDLVSGDAGLEARAAEMKGKIEAGEDLGGLGAAEGVGQDGELVEVDREAAKELQAAAAEEPLCACPSCDTPNRGAGTPLLRCSRCKKARYCSQKCQQAHWKAHKGGCRAE